MFNDLFRFVRGVWEAVLLPFVVLSIANLATDGWEAVTHLQDTLVVLGCFVWGCSHRSFPLSRSAVEAQRAALTATPTTAGPSPTTSTAASHASTAATAAANSAAVSRGGYRGTPEDEENDADSEADFPHLRRAAGTTSADAAAAGSSARPSLPTDTSAKGEDDLSLQIQRRLLLGKKGEIDEWLPARCGRLLIPPHHALCTSRSLHQLVSIVIGPIQQPTVATMPTRHPEPQWPPHFLRTGSGGGGSTAAGSVGDPSTDDYSSSNSSAAPHTMRHRSSAGATTRYRLASSVVYQRVSSRHLDFSNSQVAPHLIASITAHHVLSYPATRQKVLVMDLDETLCYVSTSTANMAGPPTFSEVIPTASGAELFHVWERPYARLFLATAAKLFNLVLFTSASKPYADTILQRIDPDNLLKRRYYRQDCRLVPRGLLKRMCAVAGQRGVSTGNVTRQGSGDRSVAVGDTPLSSFATALAGSANSGGSGVGAGGGSTTNTDDDSGGGRGRGRPAQRHSSATWGDPSTPDGKDVLSSGSDWGGSAAGATTSASTPSLALGQSTPLDGTTSNARGGHRGAEEYGFPGLEKTALNEHAKVLLKDLRILKVPPELLVMIDNSEECTLANPENALIVSPFIPSLTKGLAGEKTAPTQTSCPTPTPPAEASTPSTDNEGGVASVCGGVAAAVPGGQRSEAATSPSKSSSSSSSTGEAGRLRRDCGAADGLLLGDDMSAGDGPEEEDEVLLALLPMLECLLVVPDVRSILRLGKLY